MTIKLWELLQIDTKRDFKSLFVMSVLHGSENVLVSDKLFALIGDKMIKFQNDLMLSKPVKTLKEVIREIIQPKGINFCRNMEGSELRRQRNSFRRLSGGGH